MADEPSPGGNGGGKVPASFKRAGAGARKYGTKYGKKAGQQVVKQSTPATVILFLALLTGIIGRWAHGKSLPSGTGLIQIIFALIVITALDRGETRPIARGFAWLFLAAVLLGPDSPLAILNKPLPTKPPAKPNTGPKKGN